MSTAEITAYLHGAQCAQAGLPMSAVFLIAARSIRDGGDEQLAQAHLRLGNDVFAHWVRRGYDEAGACHA